MLAKHCDKCKQETNHHRGNCTVCELAAHGKARKEHLEYLDGLSIDARVRRLEELWWNNQQTLSHFNKLG